MPASSIASVLSGRVRHPIRRLTGTEGRPLDRARRRAVWRHLRDLRKPSARKGYQPCLKAAEFAVAETLLNVFLNRRTGRLDPSLATLARVAGVGRRTAARAVGKLERLGVLEVIRRYVMARDGIGVARPRRTSNAYAFTVPARPEAAARTPVAAADPPDGAPRQDDLAFECQCGTATKPRIKSKGMAPPALAPERFTEALQAALARLGHRIADRREPSGVAQDISHLSGMKPSASAP